MILINAVFRGPFSTGIQIKLRLTEERMFVNPVHRARARPWRSSSIDFRTRHRQPRH